MDETSLRYFLAEHGREPNAEEADAFADPWNMRERSRTARVVGLVTVGMAAWLAALAVPGCTPAQRATAKADAQIVAADVAALAADYRAALAAYRANAAPIDRALVAGARLSDALGASKGAAPKTAALIASVNSGSAAHVLDAADAVAEAVVAAQGSAK